MRKIVELKDHDYLKDLYKISTDRAAFLEKRFDDIMKEKKALRDALWENINEYLKLHNIMENPHKEPLVIRPDGVYLKEDWESLINEIKSIFERAKR